MKVHWRNYAIVLCVLSVNVCCVGASIYEVEHTFNAEHTLWKLVEGGMYAGHDPDRPGLAGKSEIIVKITFSWVNKSIEDGVELLLARPEQETMLGYRDEEKNELHYCCTEELRTKGVSGCTEVGRLIKRFPSPVDFGGEIFKEELAAEYIVPPANSTKVEYDETLVIHRTGIYSVFMSSCGNSSGEIHLVGEMAFRNPHGFLPGQLYGFLPFYTILMYIYLGVCAIWGLVCLVRRKHLLKIHYLMSALLVLGFLEAYLNKSAYSTLNRFGRKFCCPLPQGIVAADVVSVLKIVPSKVMILLLSIGWGIVGPIPTSKRSWIVLFAATCLVLKLIHDLAVLRAHGEHIPSLMTILVTLPMYVIDFTMLVWTFVELRNTRSYLRERGIREKSDLYVRLTRALLAFILIVVLWEFWAVFSAATSDQAERWRMMDWRLYFLFGGVPPGGVMWDACYLGLLVVVMLLFFPGERQSSFAFRPSEESDAATFLTTVDDWTDDN
mmetsp:Transcript_9058/g.27219  ORF Transcript_9058/g.27219 Transcript_9058/m.27219 type:complete len:496 (+) Transcript_9058:166-1653(+)|eukprot:CAMPEP_0198732246 /NCGR_PEP_ID=MMETSP1475-20131203/34568_1 /TAXON_ID= ORGANISM="Unidentified sp., Strain CCMP1999" /NCGR_SAMPLE_ID=MMETSP1475 /ASSEMBLY_ACC=CAM_ASM_001111 /LENGTH=495 /DNA_ID=CAMNT_0044495315 /DNA_START=140 /DNA_END=1627 /DNA_ORIENTATION=-